MGLNEIMKQLGQNIQTQQAVQTNPLQVNTPKTIQHTNRNPLLAGLGIPNEKISSIEVVLWKVFAPQWVDTKGITPSYISGQILLKSMPTDKDKKEYTQYVLFDPRKVGIVAFLQKHNKTQKWVLDIYVAGNILRKTAIKDILSKVLRGIKRDIRFVNLLTGKPNTVLTRTYVVRRNGVFDDFTPEL